MCVCQNTSIYVFINPKICLIFHKKYASSGNFNTSGYSANVHRVSEVHEQHSGASFMYRSDVRERQCTYDVKMRSVRATIVEVEGQ